MELAGPLGHSPRKFMLLQTENILNIFKYIKIAKTTYPKYTKSNPVVF